LHQNQALGLNLRSHLFVSSAANFVTGLELRKDKLTSTKFIVKDRNIQSFFAQAEINHTLALFYSAMQWTWIPACRWDNYSDVNSFFSPKIGLLISTGEKINY